MSQELCYETAASLARALESKKVSSREIAQALLDRVAAVDGRVQAFLGYDADDLLAQADAADRRRAAGEARGPLDGIPVALKDNLAVRGQPLECASRILEGFVSPYDAACVERLKRAGALAWGRLNMDEFAMGSSTENSAVRNTANPWDLERVPGGSSGGSAAAVAAGEATLALGSDTGGSIRQPASFCGVVGLKPTYGRVSRYGLVAFASSLDQIGPLARSVEDAALLLGAISGRDPRDSTSADLEAPDFRAEIARARGRQWTLGLPKEYFAEQGQDPETLQLVREAVAFYESQGCVVKEVSLPRAAYAVAIYYIIATAEASSNLARFDGVRYGRRAAGAKDHIDVYFKSRAEGFGAEVKRRVILGSYVLSSGYYDAYYLKAQKARTLARQDFLDAFEEVDALIAPVSPHPAFRRGEKADDPLSMYLSDIHTIGANLAGIPGLSLPCGFTRDGLPVGLQLLGKPYQEGELLAIAARYEEAHGHGQRRPNL